MKNDCQSEWIEPERPTYEELSDVAKFAVDRCIDKVRNGDFCPREKFENGEVYSYALGGDRIAWGINGLTENITRGTVKR